MTPDAEAMAALAKWLHESDDREHRLADLFAVVCRNRSTAILAALHASGWTLVRSDERDALVERVARALVRERFVLPTTWEQMRESDRERFRVKARAALEGRP